MSIHKWGSVLSLTFILLLVVPAAANANIFKDLYNLPGDVGELKEQYNATKSQLEDMTRQSLESLEQYREAQRQMLELQAEMDLAQEQMNVENDRLRSQNEQLLGQNEQLTQAVMSLQQAEEARAKKAKMWWRLIYTGLGLIIVYFCIGRIMRLFLRSRQF